MNIQQMSTRLRPRNNWEAIDLGFMLAKPAFARLWLLWLLPASGLLGLLLLLLDSHLLAWILVWWLQPLYERPLLHLLSRNLFGEQVSVKQALAQYWRIIKPQLISTLLWRRLNPGRSFNEPVTLLEGLRGKARRQRLNALGMSTSGTAVWSGLLCALFVLVLGFSLFMVLTVIVPEEWQTDMARHFTETEQSIHWGVAWLWLLAASVVAPFFVAGGFALYISRRTQLEGWDIELEFRKLNQRLRDEHSRLGSGASTRNSKSTALVLALALLLPTINSQPATAAESLSQNETKAKIEEIADRKLFGELKTRKVWQRIEKVKEAEEPTGFWKTLKEKLEAFLEWLFSWMPQLATFLKYLGIIALIGLLVWLLMRYTSWLNWIPLPGKRSARKSAPPTKLFGLELSKESLPDDIAATALALLEQQQLREALSLLFRASLSHLVHHADLAINDSSTEGECLRLVTQTRPASEVSYFQQLTRHWLLLAYAHQPPSLEDARALCQEWPQHFGSEVPA